MMYEVDLDLLPWLVGNEGKVLTTFLELLATDVDAKGGAQSSMLADRIRALSEWAYRQQRTKMKLKSDLSLDGAIDQLVLAAESGTLDCLAAARTVVDDALDDLERSLAKGATNE
tara:strand:- start:3141 stop:3485 length:345 start_codon:yes stop_codon:yes gene_type:complete